MSAGIVITGLERAQKLLGIDLRPVGQAIARGVATEIHRRIAVAPGPAKHPILWASNKQRKWWFAHRRDKGLPFEYTRNSDPESQRLEASWTVEQTPTGARVGTRASYAPWVQSAEQTAHGGPQTAQHAASKWVTDQEAVDATVASGDIERIAVSTVVAALNRG
jgi:hypothetical protein